MFTAIIALTAQVALAQQSRSAQKSTAGQSSTEPQLHQAARAGDVAALRTQLSNGVNVNLRDSAGRTALMQAAEQGQTNAVKLLIEHGADVNAAARAGTALESAERSGHMDVAALLRQAGARSSGHSLGDTVCVRPWSGDGYCGLVQAINRNNYQLRVTEIVGCNNGCAARAECSANKPVGGPDGVKVGDQVETRSWCLTHTGVQR